MLSQNITRITKTTADMPVAAAAPFYDNGMAAVFIREGGTLKIQPSTGAAGEEFAGVNVGANVPPKYAPAIEEDVVDGPYRLARIPRAGQIMVKVGGTKLSVVGSAPADATEVKLDGDTLTFHASAADKSLFVQYLYDLTVDEARQFVGDAPVGGSPSIIEERTGLIEQGDVGTDFFDATADWSDESALHPSLGADGRFTIGGDGTELKNVYIKQAPVAGNPVLVLSIH